MRVYVLLGPPGAGKGTVAPIIAERSGLRHVSTGHLIREMMKDPASDLGQRCSPYMERGDYVPDDIMLEIIQWILDDAGDTDILLDGFPRSVQQAHDLERLLSEVGRNVNGVLLMEVEAEVAVERCGYRRTCEGCGMVFHSLVRPPEQEGMCDVCGGTLALRDDDSPEMVRRRLQHFLQAVSGITAHYASKELLHRIDAGVEVDKVVRQVTDHVEQMRND